MAAEKQPARVALVLHPTRPISAPLETIERWAGENGLEIVQIAVAGGPDREVARRGELQPGDLVIALGGDGTVLSALRAAAPHNAPVLGVACGSLGALTAVHGDRLQEALQRVRGGDWTARRLPALAIQPADAPDEWAVNDFVVVRRGAGQVVVDVTVDDELYVRLAGDGLIVASPLGSSAYSMAAGGPLLAAGTSALVCTPLAMHGGSAPPLVVPANANVRVEIHPSFAGFDIEIDGHTYPLQVLDYRLSMYEEKVTLVSLDELGLGFEGLRKRRLITDSPRVLVRDDRAARAKGV
ncbi:MAG: NAD(+)/NADH kinase [Actinomycetota bacterium]|nr:NAD(+)/NADH kinase [Actinomycetota bacterium]